MGFSPSGGGTNSLASSSDVGFNNTTSKNFFTYDSSIQKWKNTSLADPSLASEIDAAIQGNYKIVNVQDPKYNGGAKGDGQTDDTLAIQMAINDASASANNRYGGTVIFPSSYSSYRYTQLFIQPDKDSVNIQLKLLGIGNAMLRPFKNIPYTSTPAATLGPSIVIAPLETPTAIAAGYIRHLTIEHLTISGNGYVYGETRANTGDTDPYSNLHDRIGISIDFVQDFVMRDCWIDHFKVGMTHRDVFDSVFSNINMLAVGYSYGDAETDDMSQAGGGYGYGLVVDRNISCSNANKYSDIHMEDCPLFILFGGGARQNTFTSCKFENSIPAEDDLSTHSMFWFPFAIETMFQGCLFTDDAIRSKPMIKATTSDATSQNTYKTVQSCMFTNNTFMANRASTALWFYGSWALFSGNVFQRSEGAGATYPFIFGSHCTFTGNRITVAGLGVNIYRISSGNNHIRDNDVYASTSATSGTMVLLDPNATSNVIDLDTFTGNFSLRVGLITGTSLGTNVITSRTSNTRTVSGGASIGVASMEFITLSYNSATNVTALAYGYIGQVVQFIATNSNVTFTPNAHLILKNGTSRNVSGPNDSVSFRCIGEDTGNPVGSETAIGIWHEI